MKHIIGCGDTLELIKQIAPAQSTFSSLLRPIGQKEYIMEMEKSEQKQLQRNMFPD